MTAPSVALRASAGRGWLVGFTNMASKEYGSWWRTRRALVHLVLWFVVINGFITLVGLDEGRSGSNPFDVLDELLQVFFRVGGLFTTIGIVVTTQSTILGERQSGTAEWVLSKPVTRPAFVLAKLLVNGLSFLGLAVVIPSTIFFVQTLWLATLQPDPLPFLGALALHVEHLVFYLAFTLVLGTLFHSRSAVSGVAIGSLFAGLILPNFLPKLATWLPWGLIPVADMVSRSRPLPGQWWLPVTMTALLTVVAVAAALWRFGREEF
jgi:ABC-2 type transport system permease protein